MTFRVGIGVDVHRLAPNRKLVLGGIEIPFERGLVGHSDGDVLLHALTDALLGAVAAPDLGSLFPSGDARWKAAASRQFVEKGVQIVEDKGYRVVQVDAVIVAEEPSLAKHFDAMRGEMANMLGIPLDAVGVKAKTSDGMGFTGRKEGIFAQAVVMVKKKEPS
jgi:2-C-methyl-D-erythritol 2,4-cyclodiphosphate synthase